jgi:putative Mg2+ transporter-C (MgtC) family protein
MSGQEIDVLLKVLLAGVLGYAVGAEREYVAHREAGSRTFSLVAMSSALITAMSLDAFGADAAARIIANIMVGVGFLGGGMILKDPGHIRGLTTAAGMWAIAAVGMVVGSGRFGLGVVTGVLILLVFSAERAESAVRRILGRPRADHVDDDRSAESTAGRG